MRKTVHFYRKYTSCHIDLIASHFYFILFVPKSQYLDNNYYVFNKILYKFFPLLPKTAYKRFDFLYNIPESGEYDKTTFQSSKITPFFATNIQPKPTFNPTFASNNYSPRWILPAQKKQGLKNLCFYVVYKITRP